MRHRYSNDPPAPPGIPALWREFGTGYAMCSWCGTRIAIADGEIRLIRGVGFDGRQIYCPRCPIRFRGMSPMEIDLHRVAQ
jgi:hypothetical protein